MSPSLSSRALGSIWGVCVGDALGGPVQFMNPNTFKPITGLRFVFPFQEPAGYLHRLRKEAAWKLT
jgi:ADP-ribosylglycohydrolase